MAEERKAAQAREAAAKLDASARRQEQWAREKKR
jgi:hypothetical protein